MDFSVLGGDEPRVWSWEEFRTLPSEEITVDIHCVTNWSKFDTVWEGVSVDTLLEGVDTSAEFVLAFSDGGYTTNLPLDELTGGKAWVAFYYDGAPLAPEHGGPARLLVPHLYFWKSAKWVRGLALRDTTNPASGRRTATTTTWRSVAGAAVPGRLSWLDAAVSAAVEVTPRTRTLVLDVPDWPGHRAGQHVDLRLTAEDGYQASRSYSLASAPGQPPAITVERLPDGEVCPYLVDDAEVGDQVELRGPDRRLLRLGRDRRRTALAGGRRLGHRPAHVDAPPPSRRRERRASKAPVLRPHAGGRHLPRRAR